MTYSSLLEVHGKVRTHPIFVKTDLWSSTDYQSSNGGLAAKLESASRKKHGRSAMRLDFCFTESSAELEDFH